MMPLARIEAASSSRRSGSKTVRGCIGLGSIESIGRCVGAAAGVLTRAGRRAERPLSNTLRCSSVPLVILENLLREPDVALGRPGPGIVHKDRFSVTWRFSQPD